MMSYQQKNSIISYLPYDNFTVASINNTIGVIATNDNNSITNNLKTSIIEEKTMLTNEEKNIPFLTKTYIYGIDINSMSEDDLIMTIKRIENDKANLSNINVESTKIKNKLAVLDNAIEQIVERLDNN